MAKPLPLPKLPPPTSRATKPPTYTVNPKTGALSYEQIQRLWVAAGGDQASAPLMAAIALAESGGSPIALNNNPNTGDYSVGLWQINYFGNLRDSRTKRYGAPDKLRDPLANAKAAVDLYQGGRGLTNWQGDAAYQAYTSGGAAGLNDWLQQYNAQLTVDQQTKLDQIKAASPEYNQAKTQEALARIQGNVEVATQTKIAKATAHLSDPWVTVTRGKGGKIVGFGEEFGLNPPANVLRIGGVPATNSMYQQAWSNVYASDYAAYTGQQATPAVQADILERGISAYTLRNELSQRPGFTSSPIYKANGPGIADQAKQILGTAPPPNLVRQAIAEGWDAATFQAHLRSLPQYTKGPEFRNNLAQNQTTYEGIYGKPDQEAQAWLKHATTQGWSPSAVGQALRSDPAYKYSPEFQAKAVGFLDAIGQITGTHPVVAPANTVAPEQQTKQSQVGGPPNRLQVSTVGG